MAPNGKAKKAAGVSNISRAKAEEYRLDHDHARYLRMLVEPHDAELARQPSLVPRRGTIVRDVITVDVQGSCLAVAKPTLAETLRIQNTGAASSSTTDAWKVMVVGRSSGNTDLVYPSTIQRSDGVSTGFSDSGVTYFNGSATGDWVYTISGNYNSAARLEIASNGIASTANFHGIPVVGTITGGIVSGQFPLSIYAHRLGDSPVDIDLQIEFVPSVAVSSNGGIRHVETYDTEVLTGVNELRYYKVIAQSLFVSYMGSELNNGGSCSAGLVNKDLTLGLTTEAYDTLARLPYDAYDGRTSEGAHVHWLPENQMDFVPIYAAESPKYQRQAAVAALLDDPTQTMRIRVTTIIEYFSDARAYGNMSYSPSWSDFDVFLALLHMHVPTATSNDDHIKKKVLRGINKLGSMAVRQAKTELTNPSNWAKLMAMLV